MSETAAADTINTEAPQTEQASESETTLLTKDVEQQQATEDQEQATPAEAEGEPEATPKAPEIYEFKLPDGLDAYDTVLESFSEVARELDLDEGSAQKVLDKVLPAFEQREAQRLQELRTDWEKQSRNDKELGGKQFDENLALASKALGLVASPELVKLLDVSGLGNHPEVIRMMVKIGRAISEDSFVPSAGTPPVGDEDLNDPAVMERRFYGKA